MQWNFNIQRELTDNLTATIGYVGSHGVHQPMRIDDANIVQPTLTEAGYVWPSPVGSGTLVNPNYGEIRSMQWIGTSVYHALQFNVTQRLAHGFQLRGSYTWGKSFDTGSSTIVGDEFLTSMSSLSRLRSSPEPRGIGLQYRPDPGGCRNVAGPGSRLVARAAGMGREGVGDERAFQGQHGRSLYGHVRYRRRPAWPQQQ